LKKSTVSETKQLKHKKRAAWIFSLAALIFVTLFGWYPLITAFVVAFQKFHFIRPSVFVGLENFRSLLFHDWMVPLTFTRTLEYCALSIGLTFFIPIVVAILLMEMRKNVIRVMMILWFIPMASMAGIVLWKWFYSPEYGLFNGILSKLGFPTLGWLRDPRLTMLCLILPNIIMYGPGLVYIATIQSIPNELYEAAELEGTSFWQKIWHITLPRLRPIIAMMLILSIIGNMQVFDLPFVMTGGGPNNAVMTVVIYIYRIAFTENKYGRGTALAILLFILTMILVVVQRKYFKENIDI